MTVFSNARRELIANMKAATKAKSHKGGGLTHSHFVLYAALRGQDIRKTSHQPDGDNARELLAEMSDTMSKDRGPAGPRKIQWFEIGRLGNLRGPDGKYLLGDEHKAILAEAFEEAQAILNGEDRLHLQAG